MRPAGTTLQANDSLPMSSSEMLAVMVLVSITIPKNVIWVLGVITFSALMGALI